MDSTTQYRKMAKAIDTAHGTSIEISHHLGTLHGRLMDNSDCPNALKTAARSCLALADKLENLADTLREAPPDSLQTKAE